MQEIVIKMPEQLACEGFERLFTEDEKDILIKAIGNGTPLPKGHGRLIDAGEYINILNNAQIEGLNTYKGLGRAKELLIDASTIIEADRSEE